MPLLDAILQKKIRLIDYEKITDSKNQRLVAFGHFAGLAGACEFLSGLGVLLLKHGINTPFLFVSCPYQYIDYSHAKSVFAKIKLKMQTTQ